jgi:hypothetical protein
MTISKTTTRKIIGGTAILTAALLLSSCSSIPTPWTKADASTGSDTAKEEMMASKMEKEKMAMDDMEMSDMKNGSMAKDASMDMSMMSFEGLSDDEIRVKCTAMHDKMKAKMKAKMESGEMMGGDHKMDGHKKGDHKMDGDHKMKKGDHKMGGDDSMMSDEMKAKHEKKKAMHDKCMEVMPEMKAMHDKVKQCVADGGDKKSCKKEAMGMDMMGGMKAPADGSKKDHQH